MKPTQTAATARYERPVEATLQVHLANGESWEATADDLNRFGLVNRHEAYLRFDDHLRNLLTDAGLIDGDITDAKLSPLRYLVELAVVHPALLEHTETAETDTEVVAIERALQEERD